MNKHPYTPLTPPFFLLCFLSLLNYNEFFLSRENAKCCASRSSCAKLFPIIFFFSVIFLKFRFCNAWVVTWQIVFFKQTWRRLVLKEVVRSSASKRRKISRSSNASQFMTLTSFAYQNGLGDKTLTHSLSVRSDEWECWFAPWQIFQQDSICCQFLSCELECLHAAVTMDVYNCRRCVFVFTRWDSLDSWFRFLNSPHIPKLKVRCFFYFFWLLIHYRFL